MHLAYSTASFPPNVVDVHRHTYLYPYMSTLFLDCSSMMWALYYRHYPRS